MKLSRILAISILVILSVLSTGVAEDSSQWSLPENAIARIGKGQITDMEYSPNGKLLAATSKIGIWLFDANSGEELTLLTGYTNEDFIGFSGNASHSSSLSFSADGKLLTSPCWDGKVRVWDVPTRKLIATIKGYHRSALLSPDGKTLAIDKNLWDTHTFTEIRSLTEDQTSMRALAFSPDGTTLITETVRDSIILWNLKTGQSKDMPIGDTDFLNTLGFSPDGKTIVCRGKRSNSVALWNTETGEQITVLSGNKHVVNSVAYSPDGNTFASSCFEMICIWDAKTKQIIMTLPRNGTRFNEVEYTPDGKTLAVARTNGRIQLIDAKTGQLKRTLIQPQAIYSLSPSPDGKMLATGALSDIILWDLHTRKPKTHLIGDTDSTTPALFSQDGKNLISISSSEDQTKLVSWNISTGMRQDTFAQNVKDVSLRSLSPDGKTLAMNIREKGIQLWDTTAGQLKKTLTTQTGEFRTMVFSPDSTLFVTGDNQSTIELWDAVTGEHNAVLTQDSGGTEALVFSQDGKVLASCSRDEARLWDMKTGSQLPTTFSTSGNKIGFYSLALSADGTILASGSYDAKIRIWNTKTGLLMDTFIGHTGAIEELVFLPQQKNEINENNKNNISIPSGKTLASRSRDDTVLLWEIRPYVETQSSVKVTPDIIESPNVGEQVTVNLDIQEVQKVNGYQLTLEFDSTAFQYITSKNGNFLPDDATFNASLVPSWSSTPNRVKLVSSCSPDAAMNDNGTLASVTFEVIAQKASTLSLPRARLENQDGSVSRPIVFSSSVRKPSIMKDTPLDTMQLSLPEGVKARLGRGTINDIKFSPDNTQFAVASSIGIWIYNINNGEAQSLFADNFAIKIAFSPDGRFIASSGSDRKVRVWNLINSQLLRTFDIDQRYSNNNAIAFSPDGRTLANGIELWDIHTGQHKTSLKWHHTDRVQAMTFSTDGKMLATTTRRSNVRLWDVASGQEIAKLHEGGEYYSQDHKVAFSSDGTKLSAIVSPRNRQNGSVMLWNTQTHELEKTVIDKRYSLVFVSIDFSNEGNPIAVVREQKKLYVKNLDTEENIAILEGHDEIVHIAAFSPDKTMLASAGNSGSIRLWDTETGRLRSIFSGFTNAITSVAMMSNGTTLVTANREQPMQLWDSVTLENKGAFQGVRDPYSASVVTFSPDEIILAGGAYDDVVLWDVNSLQKTATLKGHRGQIKTIVFSPDGRTLAAFGMYDKTIQLWNVSTGEEKFKLNGHAEKIFSLMFSPDGTKIATTEALTREEHAIRLWDAKTGENITTFANIVNARSGRQLPVMAVAFSPDGKVVVSLDLSTDIQLWDVETKKHKSTLKVDVMDIYGSYDGKMDIAFSPDGKTLVSTGLSAIINVWGVETGKHQNTLNGHTGRITSLEYTADGTTLVSGSTDGTVLFWKMNTSPITRLDITPNTVQSPPIGQQLTFNINITDAKNVNGYQFTINYDASALRYISKPEIENNTILLEISENTITLSGNAAQGQSIADGTIVSATFEVLKRTDVILEITNAHLTHNDGTRSNPVVGQAKVVEPPRIPEDVNLDWQIDDADLEFVSKRLGQKGKDNPADVNKDGIVDIADLVLVRNALYGTEPESESE